MVVIAIRGFADSPVTDDELALTTTYGDHGVDRDNTGLDGLDDVLTSNDALGNSFYRIDCGRFGAALPSMGWLRALTTRPGKRDQRGRSTWPVAVARSPCLRCVYSPSSTTETVSLSKESARPTVLPGRVMISFIMTPDNPETVATPSPTLKNVNRHWLSWSWW